MTRQAVQLGFLPRLSIRHTSAREIGQVYAPAINWVLFIAVVGPRAGFRLIHQTGLGLRHRRHRHDHGRHHPLPRRRQGTVAKADLDGGGRRPWCSERSTSLSSAQMSRRSATAPGSRSRSGCSVFSDPRHLEAWEPRQVRAVRVEKEGPLKDFVSGSSRDGSARLSACPGTAVYLNARRETTPLALRASLRAQPHPARNRGDHLDPSRPGSPTSPEKKSGWRWMPSATRTTASLT